MKMSARVASLEARNQPPAAVAVVIKEVDQSEDEAVAQYEAANGVINPRGLTVIIERMGQ